MLYNTKAWKRVVFCSSTQVCEAWSTANEFKPHPHPRDFIAGRLKAALLFWFYGDVRCGVLLFIVILFPRDISGEIWDLVSEGFPTYFCSDGTR